MASSHERRRSPCSVSASSSDSSAVVASNPCGAGSIEYLGLRGPGGRSSWRPASQVGLAPTFHSGPRPPCGVWRVSAREVEAEITVPAMRRARLAGVRVHDSLVGGPGHVASVDGIPVSSMARTLCDLSAVVPSWTVERAIDEALRRKLVTLRALARVAASLAGRGRRRSTVIRDALAARDPSYDPGESAPEARLVQLLTSWGLPRPVQQHPIRLANRTVRADLAYPEHMLVIEYDGWTSTPLAAPSTPTAREPTSSWRADGRCCGSRRGRATTRSKRRSARRFGSLRPRAKGSCPRHSGVK
jgi:hypothetical protein